MGRDRDATDPTADVDATDEGFEPEQTGERRIVDDGTPRTSSQLVAIVAEVGARLARRSVLPPPKPDDEAES